MESTNIIERLIHQCRNGSVKERVAAIAGLQARKVKEAVPTLMELLGSPESIIRANSAYALGTLGDATVGPLLKSLLQDSDSMVRLKAAEALGELKFSKSIESLINVLRYDNDPLVRIHAAETLGKMNDAKKTIPALLQALYDPDEMVRAYAADSIAETGDKEALPALSDRINLEQSLFTKAFLLSALYRLGHEQALGELTMLSGSADDDLAATVLNLAVETVRSRDKRSLKQLIIDATNARPGLYKERVALLKRIE